MMPSRRSSLRARWPGRLTASVRTCPTPIPGRCSADTPGSRSGESGRGGSVPPHWRSASGSACSTSSGDRRSPARASSCTQERRAPAAALTVSCASLRDMGTGGWTRSRQLASALGTGQLPDRSADYVVSATTCTCSRPPRWRHEPYRDESARRLLRSTTRPTRLLPPRGGARPARHAGMIASTVRQGRDGQVRASRDELDEPRRCSHAKGARALEIPYRTVERCTADLGFAPARGYDLEAWSPGVGQWLEVSSCSNYTDFQARRMNLRYRGSADARPELLHTLNGSGLGMSRTYAALLETHLQPDGSIRIPAAWYPTSVRPIASVRPCLDCRCEPAPRREIVPPANPHVSREFSRAGTRDPAQAARGGERVYEPRQIGLNRRRGGPHPRNESEYCGCFIRRAK